MSIYVGKRYSTFFPSAIQNSADLPTVTNELYWTPLPSRLAALANVTYTFRCIFMRSLKNRGCHSELQIQRSSARIPAQDRTSFLDHVFLVVRLTRYNPLPIVRVWFRGDWWRPKRLRILRRSLSTEHKTLQKSTKQIQISRVIQTLWEGGRGESSNGSRSRIFKIFS